MSMPLRIATLVSVCWAAAVATVFAALSFMAPESTARLGAGGMILGCLIEAVTLVPLSLLALRAAEHGGVRTTAPSRLGGAVLICALPLLGVLILLDGEGGLLRPVEAVAFAFAGLVVGVVVGVAYPWVRGPFRRGPRRKPREDVEGPGEAVAR